MVRIVCLISFLISCNSGFAQTGKPWEWQKDQNKYALYADGAAPRRPITDVFRPHANEETIYAHDRKGYGQYAHNVASSYAHRYDLDRKQSKTLNSDLRQLYNMSGTKAVYVHRAVEELLTRWLSSEQMAQWRQLKNYPEYDAYYLEKGRSLGWNYNAK